MITTENLMKKQSEKIQKLL